MTVIFVRLYAVPLMLLVSVIVRYRRVRTASVLVQVIGWGIINALSIIHLAESGWFVQGMNDPATSQHRLAGILSWAGWVGLVLFAVGHGFETRATQTSGGTKGAFGSPA